jgi:hypothetical protein
LTARKPNDLHMITKVHHNHYPSPFPRFWDPSLKKKVPVLENRIKITCASKTFLCPPYNIYTLIFIKNKYVNRKLKNGGDNSVLRAPLCILLVKYHSLHCTKLMVTTFLHDICRQFSFDGHN